MFLTILLPENKLFPFTGNMLLNIGNKQHFNIHYETFPWQHVATRMLPQMLPSVCPALDFYVRTNIFSERMTSEKQMAAGPDNGPDPFSFIFIQTWKLHI